MNPRAIVWPGPFSFNLTQVLVRDTSPARGHFPPIPLQCTKELGLGGKKYSRLSFHLFPFTLQAIVMFDIIFSSLWKRKAFPNLGFGKKGKLLWKPWPLTFPVSHCLSHTKHWSKELVSQACVMLISWGQYQEKPHMPSRQSNVNMKLPLKKKKTTLKE